MGNIIIGVGNCGTNCVKLASSSSTLADVTMYTIDSVANQVNMDDVGRIKFIPIISDEKSGSGRLRERGAEMFKYHESNGAFNEMYEECKNAKQPIIVITSGAGGTGSGATVPLCTSLLSMGLQIIPVIVCPNKNDPDAFHLNTNDLFVELGDIGISTYSVFENRRGDADYEPVNREVVTLVEIIFGKKYDKTDKDSIDDSDLDTVLNTPGRFIAVAASAPTAQILQREITRKVFSGFQPVWDEEDSKECTLMTAYSLKSIFADKEYAFVFSEVNKRLSSMHQFDEYRNIVNDDNNGVSEASIIIAGLPRPKAKEISTEYYNATGIAAGIGKSARPNFLNRKTVIRDSNDPNYKGGKFNWGFK